MQVKAISNYQQEDRFEITGYPSESKLNIDKEKDNYQPIGPNPLELLLSSLSGCISVYAKKYLTKHKIEFKNLSVTSTAKLSQDSPLHLVDFNTEVETDADLGKKSQIFLKFIKSCPIHNTITKKGNINISLK